MAQRVLTWGGRRSLGLAGASGGEVAERQRHPIEPATAIPPRQGQHRTTCVSESRALALASVPANHVSAKIADAERSGTGVVLALLSEWRQSNRSFGRG
eukprot:1278577-Rhodomonas_salina.1